MLLASGAPDQAITPWSSADLTVGTRLGSDPSYQVTLVRSKRCGEDVPHGASDGLVALPGTPAAASASKCTLSTMRWRCTPQGIADSPRVP